MVEISYVYPNVSEIAQRGGLVERWHLARKLECDYVEVPADFIKKKTELDKTGLNLGDFLTDEAIALLYNKDIGVPQGLKYILHTEPSLSRKDSYGLSYQAPLKWYNKEWVKRLIKMVISLVKFFGIPASIIEIHPGDRRNSFDAIARSMTLLIETYKEEFGAEPHILIENRTGQFISSGKEIQCFWQSLSRNYPKLERRAGIVLDVQQLYTVTKKNFLRELEMIPLESLKGFHIHYKHGVPNVSDEIPWKQVFCKISEIREHIIINPEIHHKNQVEAAIDFCEKMLHENL